MDESWGTITDNINYAADARLDIKKTGRRCCEQCTERRVYSLACVVCWKGGRERREAASEANRQPPSMAMETRPSNECSLKGSVPN